MNITTQQALILAELEHGPSTSKALAATLGISFRVVSAQLSKLMRAGRLRRHRIPTPFGAGRPMYRYRLPATRNTPCSRTTTAT